MAIEQLQMMIKFMSSVDGEHSMSFNINFLILIVFLFSERHEKMIYLFRKTEIWSLDEKDDTINMKIADPNLNNYRYYTELFIVDSDFCTKK